MCGGSESRGTICACLFTARTTNAQLMVKRSGASCHGDSSLILHKSSFLKSLKCSDGERNCHNLRLGGFIYGMVETSLCFSHVLWTIFSWDSQASLVRAFSATQSLLHTKHGITDRSVVTAKDR